MQKLVSLEMVDLPKVGLEIPVNHKEPLLADIWQIRAIQTWQQDRISREIMLDRMERENKAKEKRSERIQIR